MTGIHEVIVNSTQEIVVNMTHVVIANITNDILGNDTHHDDHNHYDHQNHHDHHGHHDNGDGHSHGSDTFYATFYWVAAIVTIPLSSAAFLSNLLLIVLFIKDKFFHTASYSLMLACIISDTISNFAIITNYVYLLGNNFDHGDGIILCKFVSLCLLVSYAISILNLSLIAITRYYAVVRPYTVFYRRHKSKIIIIAEIMIWVTSLSIAIPSIIYSETYHQDAVLCGYIHINTSISVYLINLVIILYFLPSIIIGLSYWAIIKHQMHYNRPGRIMNCRQSLERERKRKFIRMLISITIPYLVLTWPYFATLLGLAITHHSLLNLLNENSIALFVLAFLSLSITSSISIINPIFLFKFCQKIRSKTRLMLHRVCFTTVTVRPEIVVAENKSALSLLDKSKSEDRKI